MHIIAIKNKGFCTKGSVVITYFVCNFISISDKLDSYDKKNVTVY